MLDGKLHNRILNAERYAVFMPQISRLLPFKCVAPTFFKKSPVAVNCIAGYAAQA